MASVTFNFTAAQSQRIQAAADAYNVANNTTLTPKQYLMWAIRSEIINRLVNSDTTRQTIQAAATTDMIGEA